MPAENQDFRGNVRFRVKALICSSDLTVSGIIQNMRKFYLNLLHFRFCYDIIINAEFVYHNDITKDGGVLKWQNALFAERE